MIRTIRSISDFGVFRNYAAPADIEEFAECNVIYGWNYSGKTTLSRLFQAIENKSVHPDYPGASFVVESDSNGQLSDATLVTTNLTVRVFNYDFVASNLSWDGSDFTPILLLGDQSIQAQQEIDKNKGLIERLREGYRRKSTAVRIHDDGMRDAKTETAKSIRKHLSLVETYTAAHLNQQLATVRTSAQSNILSDPDLADAIKRATASETDKLPRIAYAPPEPKLVAVTKDLGKILSTCPEMTNSIQYLIDNVDVANWIKSGLPLHEGKSSCEFCGSILPTKRRNALDAHFSEDLARHEQDLKTMKALIQQSRLPTVTLHEREIYDALRGRFRVAQKHLTKAIDSYNKKLDECLDAIDEKAKAPFSETPSPKIDAAIDSEILDAQGGFADVIKKSNQITDDFSQEKSAAISRLKRHYAAEFCISQDLDGHDQLASLLETHKLWYEGAGRALKQRNDDLEAQISNAQKGREELNSFIDKFLTGSNIKIEVVSVEGQDRFRLTRNGFPAKNLSEGEKTAIAFGFFLTKLRELPKLDEAIVYIDDPVSSLDSNHLFQVNAVIREFFYFQDSSANSEWKLRVKQLFCSTHNFEFLTLLKEMPIKKKQRCKHYFVKRVASSDSVFMNMPGSISRYTSEYQYLWSVIHDFHMSADKADLAVLLSLPNAVRRFIELYTYSKIPSPSNEGVDSRAEILFGAEKSKRLMKVLHHFSHSNNLLGITQNSDLIADIENVVSDLVDHVKADALHYNALMAAIA